jgi:hypothetical protein
MRKSKSKEMKKLTSRMEWYFDEVPDSKSTERHVREQETNRNKTLAPLMNYYFDEITEKESIRCPVTGSKATIEIVRKASLDNSLFLDVTYCSIFWLYSYLQHTMLEMHKSSETLSKVR